MPFRDILINIDNSRSSTSRIEFAIRLAEIHKAHLTGLYVSASPERISSLVKEHT